MTEVIVQIDDSDRLTYRFKPQTIKEIFVWLSITWLMEWVVFTIWKSLPWFCFSFGFFGFIFFFVLSRNQVDRIIFNKDSDTLIIQHEGLIYTQCSSYCIQDIVSITAGKPRPDDTNVTNYDGPFFHWIEIRLKSRPEQIIKILPMYCGSDGYVKAQGYVDQILQFLNRDNNIESNTNCEIITTKQTERIEVKE